MNTEIMNTEIMNISKYVIIEFIKGRCGGLGDRIVGLVSAIQISKIMKRQLIIKFDSNEFKNIFDYTDYNFEKFNIENSKDKALLLNFIDNQDKAKIFFMQPNLNNILNQYQVLNIKCNCNIGQYLYDNPYINYKKINYINDIKNIYQNLYITYLKPSIKIKHEINNFMENFIETHNKNKIVIGIQIRTGDKFFNKNGSEIVPNDNLENIILYFKDMIENKLFFSSDKAELFICYDNPLVEPIIKTVFNNYNYYFYQAPISHIDKSIFDENSFNKVIIDQILLSKTDFLLISNSNLARTSYLMSNASGYCLRYDKKENSYNFYKLDTEYASSKQMKINIWDDKLPEYIYP